MNKPFYEQDFDVKEYVSKRILEMDSLADRILYKEMAENFMLPLFYMQREKTHSLTKKILEETDKKEEKYNIYIGIIDNNKYDGTDTFLTPIINDTKTKIDISQIKATISKGEIFFLNNIYVKESYPNIEKFKEQDIFKGKIKTTEGEYNATFKVSFDDRYLTKIKDLFDAFHHNGIGWETLCVAHLLRMFSLSIQSVDANDIKGEFIECKVDFSEWSVIENMLPLWNIWEVFEKTSAFPIAINGGLKFEHTVLLKQFKKNSRFIIGNSDTKIYCMTKNKSSLAITCNENVPKEWLFYELHTNEKKEDYTYPLLSNVCKSSLIGNIQKEYQSRLNTKAEVLRIVNQSPFRSEVSLLNIEVLNNYNQRKQNYSMNEFLLNEVISHEDKKVLLLSFKPTDMNEYLIYDYISFIATMVQEHLPHYHLICEITGD